MTFLRLIPVVLAAITVGAYFAVLFIDPESAVGAGIGFLLAMAVYVLCQMCINNHDNGRHRNRNGSH